MNRATTAYFVMAAILVAGLWGIISAGRHLRAPADLNGRYDLQWSPGPTTANAPSQLIIEQSGRFYLLRLIWSDHSQALQGRAAVAQVGAAISVAAASSDHQWNLTLSGPAPDSLLLDLETPWHAKAAAHRARAPSAAENASNVSPAGEVASRLSAYAQPIALLFMQIILILALSRVVGMLFARLRQPQVMGEMVAGIILGPSLFGLLFPHAFATIFPASAMPTLDLLSEVGVIFFLFLIGLELDPKLLRDRGGAAVLIGHMSIVAPFLLGAGATLYFFPRLFQNTPDMKFISVALFMGAAMSTTAFPVLARILTERNLHKTRIGAISITAAAVNDVSAWCMLAFVVAVARSTGLHQAIVTAVGATIFITVMFLLVRPFLRRLQIIYERQGRLSQNVVSIIFLLILASAFITQIIGIHALFGGFLLGCIMPKGTRFVRHLSEKLEDYTVVFLLPIFFASAGLKTQLALLNSAPLWLDAALIILIACAGKFGGSATAARLCGMPLRESSAIGILMNTRGLMELVILLMGRELGIISDAIFAMMVLMALITTAMTTPLLHWLYPRGLLPEGDAAKTQAGAAARPPNAFSILIPVSLPKSGAPLVQIADMLIGRANPNGKLVALHLRRPADHAVYRSGLDELTAQEPDESLAPLLAQAGGRSIAVEPLTFISRDVPADIASIARSKAVDLVLIGFHKPIVGKTILGGTVHRILSQCEADVAIFVERGFREARRILVPYLGTAHDRLAMALAGRMARNTDAQVTVLHVVPPMRGDASRSLDARGVVDRVFHDPNQPAPVTFRVVEDASPVGVVLHQARDFDLVVIGVAEEWGLESQLFGWRAERIARDCPASLLIVRKYQRPVQKPTPPGTEFSSSPVALSAPPATIAADMLVVQAALDEIPVTLPSTLARLPAQASSVPQTTDKRNTAVEVATAAPTDPPR